MRLKTQLIVSISTDVREDVKFSGMFEHDIKELMRLNVENALRRYVADHWTSISVTREN